MGFHDRRWGDSWMGLAPEDVVHRYGLQEMCDEGVKLLADPKYSYTVVEFRIGREDEAGIIEAYMAKVHPGVPFQIGRLFLQP
ncbi:hypothetical protein BAJUN_01500 [Bajunvirus bajun]|uniref:Uncharacterized protein n=1 Tax=Brevundimonas phage vB_BgoS-Bajun TaxID=2948594 RepID=A0A9E7SU47_9CAUD|nr:hypothetical protein BAJUN_01500 [Brevundimonas phage vB_BgoS-Bajun]